MLPQWLFRLAIKQARMKAFLASSDDRLRELPISTHGDPRAFPYGVDMRRYGVLRPMRRRLIQQPKNLVFFHLNSLDRVAVFLYYLPYEYGARDTFRAAHRHRGNYDDAKAR